MRMFGRLAEGIESLSIPVDGDALIAVLALRDRLDAKIASAVSEFDAAGLWELDGATSMTAWLKDRGARSSREAGRTAAVGKRLRELPALADAWRDGRLSG